MKQIIKPDENSDLGLGSVVTQESRQRFLNRNGTFNVSRLGLPLLSPVNIYHLLLTIKWTRFLGIAFAFFILINLIFAAAYLLCGAEAIADTSVVPLPNDFWRAFFFSVETFATIGYGTIHPIGYPANVLMTLEAFVSIIAQALVTGLLFARFSRPTAEVRFSDQAVVAPYRGITALMFRVVNQRSNQLIEVKAQVTLSRFVNENGVQERRFAVLELERPLVPFMPLAWTVVHPITEDSPMFNTTHEDLVKSDAEIMIVLSGNDETYAQTVYKRSSYKPNEIEWNVKFASLYVRDEELTQITIDVRRLSETEKI